MHQQQQSHITSLMPVSVVTYHMPLFTIPMQNHKNGVICKVEWFILCEEKQTTVFQNLRVFN